MSAKKIQRVHEWQLDYKTARQRILRLSERKLRRLRKTRQHVSNSRCKYLLIKNVKSYIKCEQISEEFQSDHSDSKDDSWSHIDHKNTSPEPPAPETPTVEVSTDDTKHSTKTDTGVQNEGSGSTKVYENFLQTDRQSVATLPDEIADALDSLGVFLTSGL